MKHKILVIGDEGDESSPEGICGDDSFDDDDDDDGDDDRWCHRSERG